MSYMIELYGFANYTRYKTYIFLGYFLSTSIRASDYNVGTLLLHMELQGDKTHMPMQNYQSQITHSHTQSIRTSYLHYLHRKQVSPEIKILYAHNELSKLAHTTSSRCNYNYYYHAGMSYRMHTSPLFSYYISSNKIKLCKFEAKSWLTFNSLSCTLLEHQGHSSGVNLHSVFKCSGNRLRSNSFVQP